MVFKLLSVMQNVPPGFLYEWNLYDEFEVAKFHCTSRISFFYGNKEVKDASFV
jgi:hypothetical protein